MTPGDLFRLSIGALSAHRIRTRLTVAAVAIGVASVLLLTALGESARNYVMNQFAGIGSNLLIVIPGKIETTGGPPMTPGGTQPQKPSGLSGPSNTKPRSGTKNLKTLLSGRIHFSTMCWPYILGALARIERRINAIRVSVSAAVDCRMAFIGLSFH